METGKAPSRPGARRISLTPLLALTALGAALRFATLGLQSYWSDEAVTAGLLHQGLGSMLHALPGSESTPPLYYVLAWFWTRPFGLSEVGLRSLSAVAGTATIPVAWLLAERLATRRAALVAAALVAVNPLLWWYSQEARSYALVVLFTVAATAAFVEVLRGGRRAVWWWAAAAALALTTHYFALFVVAPQAVWLAWRDWRFERRFPSAPAVVTLVGVALLPLLVRQASNNGAKFIETSSSLAFRVAQVPKQFLVGFDAPLERAFTVIAVLLALVGATLVVTRTSTGERRGAALMAATAAVVIAVPVVGALVGADYVIARNLIPALVPALILLAIGFGARGAGIIGSAAAAALCVLSLATIIAVDVTPGYQRDDWRGIADALGPAQTDRVVVVTPADGAVALDWYLPGAQTTGSPVSASELDQVGLGQRMPGQKPRPPRGPFPVPAGFAVVRRSEGPTFTAIVTRAPTPRPVDYSFTASQRLSPTVPAAVVFQPAARP